MKKSKVTTTIAKLAVRKQPLHVPFTLRIHSDVLATLDEMANNMDVSRNELIKTYLEQLSHEYKKQVK